jgi:hypothetical protein
MIKRVNIYFMSFLIRISQQTKRELDTSAARVLADAKTLSFLDKTASGAAVGASL